MSHFNIRLFFTLIFIFIFFNSFSQTISSTILINGTATDAFTRHAVKPLQIVNKHNIQRFYGDSLGNFVVQCAKTDTLYFVAKGYATISRCYKDSVPRKIYSLSLKMYRFSVDLPEVTVQTSRDFGQVHEQAQKLGYNQKDYMVHGFQILQSPFTFLYELLSTREKDKRGYAQLMNEGRKKELVQDLVTNYISLGILDLETSEIHDFVEFTEVPEDFLKTTNEYDFIRYLQYVTEQFHHRRLPPPPPDPMQPSSSPHK